MVQISEIWKFIGFSRTFSKNVINLSTVLRLPKFLVEWKVSMIKDFPVVRSFVFVFRCCCRHSLHVIMDEIYMLCVFKEGSSVTNVLALKE